MKLPKIKLSKKECLIMQWGGAGLIVAAQLANFYLFEISEKYIIALAIFCCILIYAGMKLERKC